LTSPVQSIQSPTIAAVTDTQTEPRFAGLSVSNIALLSTIVIALLLFLPIRISDAGDHEKRSCGNAVSINLDRWARGDPADGYFEKAFYACTTRRVNRLAESAAVMSVTILAVAVLTGRRRLPLQP
jgi:hypothetical protein